MNLASLSLIVIACIMQVYAGGHADVGYVYLRNRTPYDIALHALQETDLSQISGTVDKVQRVWYAAPSSTQRLGRMETLSHVRIRGDFADNSRVPDSLRSAVDVPLPGGKKEQNILITVFLDADELHWRIETIFVGDVITQAGGTSGYHLQKNVY